LSLRFILPPSSEGGSLDRMTSATEHG
jgi:hypothetical protein